jgi:ABC-2 type transport system permease protein
MSASPLDGQLAEPAERRSVATAALHLLGLSIRRQLFARHTLVSIGLTLLVSLIVLAWSRQPNPTTKKLAEQVLVTLYVGFLIPVFAICHGASAVGGEREDRTLIYLLIVPLPRWLTYAVKWLAAALVAAAWTAGGLWLFCTLAGRHGEGLIEVFGLAAVLGVIAYTSLFLGVGALFRHGTIISLAYWFFLEVLFGNVPGIMKRVSVAFYTRCLIYDRGSELQLGPLSRVARETFLPVEGGTALIALCVISAALLVVGAAIFQKREYPELT